MQGGAMQDPTMRREAGRHTAVPRPTAQRGATRPRPGMLPCLLALALLTAACAAGGDGLAPPLADVAGIQVLAVFPFENDTAPAGLEDELHDLVLRGLQDVGWYEVVPAEQVEAMLARHRPSTLWNIDDAAWLELARDMAAEAGADGFILGRVTDYSDAVTMGAPYRVADTSPPEWRADQTTRVVVALDVRLVNVHTGDVVHEQRSVGIGVIDSPRLLNWALPSDPPASLIPSPHRRDVALARTRAVRQAFLALADHLLPRRPAESTEQANPDDYANPADHADPADHANPGGRADAAGTHNGDFHAEP